MERPVGALLQTVELVSSLQRGEAPRTARPAAQRIGNSVPRGVVTPRLEALGHRRQHNPNPSSNPNPNPNPDPDPNPNLNPNPNHNHNHNPSPNPNPDREQVQGGSM